MEATSAVTHSVTLNQVLPLHFARFIAAFSLVAIEKLQTAALAVCSGVRISAQISYDNYLLKDMKKRSPLNISLIANPRMYRHQSNAVK